MALEPLATTADLAARGISVSAPLVADKLLAAASAAVRDAAGAAISQLTSTVTLTGTRERFLPLPAGPVVSVDAVSANNKDITDFVIIDGQLYREFGWQFFLSNDQWQFTRAPSLITVTFTHGLAEVPDDIIDLVCSMVGQRVKTGYNLDPRLAAASIDDYREQYNLDVQVGQLPESTREWLRQRFTTNAYTTGTHR